MNLKIRAGRSMDGEYGH